MIKTVTLKEGVNEIDISGGIEMSWIAYPFAHLKVRSGTGVFVSQSSDVSDGTDGTACVEGTARVDLTGDRLYLIGSGAVVEIHTSITAMPPFKRASEGGDQKQDILPYSEGLTAYFDYRKNVSGSGWTDIDGNLTIEGPVILNEDSVKFDLPDSGSVHGRSPIKLKLTNAFTAYIVYEYAMVDDTNLGIFSQFQVTPTLQIVDKNGYIGIYSNPDGWRYASDVKNEGYHICALTFLNGTVVFYIDGEQKYSGSGFGIPAPSSFMMENFCNYKSLAFFENAAQSHEYILKNSQFLASKYGIQA